MVAHNRRTLAFHVVIDGGLALLVLAANLCVIKSQAPSPAAGGGNQTSISFPLVPTAASLGISKNITTTGSLSLNVYSGQRLVDETIMILDVNSIVFKGNHPYDFGQGGPDIPTVDLCAKRCAQTTNCTAFVSCDKRDGCARGCRAYVGANPALTNTARGLDNYVNNPLPFRSFGFFTYPLYYLNGCATRNGTVTAMTNDKWGWGLCSLHAIVESKEVKFTRLLPGSLDGEFASGVLVRPPNCPKGLPYSICSKCNSLDSDDQKASCLECAGFFRVNNPVKEATTVQLQLYDYCPLCYLRYPASMEEADLCVACLQSNADLGMVERCLKP